MVAMTKRPPRHSETAAPSPGDRHSNGRGNSAGNGADTGDAESGGVEGGLLAVTREGIIGWARQSDRPGVPVKVVVSIDGWPVATAVADRFDLAAVRDELGEGVPGFAVLLAEAPNAHLPYHITARSACGTVLGWPLQVRTPEDILPAIKPAAAPDYEGVVEFLRAGKLTGWVWNRSDPRHEVTVTVLDGETPLGQATANVMREDLRRAGKRDGACGFTFDLPATLLDMRMHSLRVVVAETGGMLRNCPLVFGPTQMGPIIAEILALRDEVKRLAAHLPAAAPSGNGLLRTNDMVLRHMDLDLRVLPPKAN
jgi:hypothetical protein